MGKAEVDLTHNEFDDCPEERFSDVPVSDEIIKGIENYNKVVS
jgi:hypothetical protein